jgi:hypothetical protein
MIEFSAAGFRYRAEKLDCFQQWDVARKISPIVAAMGNTLVRLIKERIAGKKFEPGKALELLMEMKIEEAVKPMTVALASLPDADSRFILNTCLSKVQRQVGASWANLMAPNGILMYPDLQMPAMLAIVWRVLEDNLLSFSFGPPSDETAGQT